MSDSVRPHRRQPTRLHCPWNSPGKNTGVGCHCLLQFKKVKSESEVAQLCPTLSDPMDCSLPGSSVRGIFQARVLEGVPSPSKGLMHSPFSLSTVYPDSLQSLHVCIHIFSSLLLSLLNFKNFSVTSENSLDLWLQFQRVTTF